VGSHLINALFILKIFFSECFILNDFHYVAFSSLIFSLASLICRFSIQHIFFRPWSLYLYKYSLGLLLYLLSLLNFFNIWNIVRVTVLMSMTILSLVLIGWFTPHYGLCFPKPDKACSFIRLWKMQGVEAHIKQHHRNAISKMQNMRNSTK
jgi:hypothetical protein